MEHIVHTRTLRHEYIRVGFLPDGPVETDLDLTSLGITVVTRRPPDVFSGDVLQQNVDSGEATTADGDLIRIPIVIDIIPAIRFTIVCRAVAFVLDVQECTDVVASIGNIRQGVTPRSVDLHNSGGALVNLLVGRDQDFVVRIVTAAIGDRSADRTGVGGSQANQWGGRQSGHQSEGAQATQNGSHLHG